MRALKLCGCRRWAKALRRAQELGRMEVWGYRAEVTLAHIRTFAREIKGEFSRKFLPVALGSLNTAMVWETRALLGSEYRRLEADGNRARPTAGKDRTQSSIKQSYYKWIRDECKQSTMLMKSPHGGFTVDRNERLDFTLDEWRPFGPFMRKGHMELDSLSGNFLAEVARETCASAPSCGTRVFSCFGALVSWRFLRIWL